MDKNQENIRALILDVGVSDEKVKNEMENLVFKEVDKEILFLLKEKRPKIYACWSLEIASEYM